MESDLTSADSVSPIEKLSSQQSIQNEYCHSHLESNECIPPTDTSNDTSRSSDATTLQLTQVSDKTEQLETTDSKDISRLDEGEQTNNKDSVLGSFESDNSTKDLVERKMQSQIQQFTYHTDQILKSVYQFSEVPCSPVPIQLMTDGFIARFLPSLMKAQSSINQIKTSQSVLIETVQQETSKFTDCQAIPSLSETMSKAKQYHMKLLTLKKEMTELHEKSKKLKRRAVKLQQQKQKEEMARAQHQEKEFEKERMLTARVAASHE